MTQHQYTKQGSTRQYQRPRRHEHPGIESERAFRPDRGEEVSLRIKAPGYGGTRSSAVVPAGTLAEIERRNHPVDTDLKIRVPGYGWRVVGAQVSPHDIQGVPGEPRSVKVRVPGYGGASIAAQERLDEARAKLEDKERKINRISLLAFLATLLIVGSLTLAFFESWVLAALAGLVIGV